MGDKTAGSSGNPRFVETRGKIKVRLPRWDDRDPQQNVIEGKGIPPEVQVDVKPEELTKTSDPVFKKALETLREIPDDERAAGRRDPQ
jgi:C-terminal processing protease CtpA/Prc